MERIEGKEEDEIMEKVVCWFVQMMQDMKIRPLHTLKYSMEMILDEAIERYDQWAAAEGKQVIWKPDEEKIFENCEHSC